MIFNLSNSYYLSRVNFSDIFLESNSCRNAGKMEIHYIFETQRFNKFKTISTW